MDPSTKCGPLLLTQTQWANWAENLTGMPANGAWADCLNDEACARVVFSFVQKNEHTCSDALTLHISDELESDSQDFYDIVNCLNKVCVCTLRKNTVDILVITWYCVEFGTGKCR